MDCTETWYVVRDPLAKLFAKVNDWAQLHARTCAYLFHISERAGRIALKFGMWLETHQLSILQKLMLGTCARAAAPGGYSCEHVGMYASLFRISGADGRTALEFGVWLGVQ